MKRALLAATMLVAAESPPMKTKAVSQSAPAESGSDSTKTSGTPPPSKCTAPAIAIGTTKALISSR